MKNIYIDLQILYQRETLAEKISGDLFQRQIQVLQKLKADNRKDAVMAIAPILGQRSKLTPYVRQTVARLLNHFSARDYLALEVHMRSGSWSHHWHYEPMHAADVDELAANSLALYGIFSFHSSGYVREQAVRALAQFASPEAFPFLLLRINDWVPQVRKLAEDALVDILKEGNQSELLQSLPLVDHVRKFYRGERGDLFPFIDQFLRARPASEILEAFTKSPLPDVRRALVRLLVTPEKDGETIRLALDDSDPIVRTLAFQKMSQGATLSWNSLQDLCRSRYREQRCQAFTLVARTQEEDAKELLIQGLMDRSASVRNICQYYLRKNFGFDPSLFYEKRIPEPYAVIGLGEMDARKYAGELHRVLDSCSDPRIISAVMIVLGQADPEAHESIFADQARSENRGVATTALRQLLRCGRLDPGLLLELHAKRDVTMRRTVIRFSRRLSKWTSLSLLLQLDSQEESAENSQLIAQFITNIPVRKKRVFTRPSKTQSEIIRSLLPRLDRISAATKDEILADLKFFE